MRLADAPTRARILADLRALTAFLTRRPEVPVPAIAGVDVTYFPSGAPSGTDEAKTAEIDRVADLLGTRAAWEGEHYVAQHRIGAAAYRAVAIPDHAIAAQEAVMGYRPNIRP
ncbi:hypothetical protein [Streptomonospora salina]|uniref:Uncharacterized protein n=1 Tax=Streptomonospora salina TaxID=104205 RepID=A0A841ECL2_9ACTN|nr:hypothetical protein [Streptomonospora salina]MBB6000134.1 hypothetical protein [Streptomonospora salina]